MEFSLLNLKNILLIMCILFSVSQSGTTSTMRIFSGTLTKITCSATQAGFRLTKQDMVYGPEEYSQLPDLFDIEARVSPTGSNATLYIDGTNRSNNVNVTCRDFSRIALGTTETIFTLVLEFVSYLPAPSNVRYRIQSPPTQLQVIWQQPNLFSSQNVKIDARISHYVVSIFSEDLMTTSNVSGTIFSIDISNASCGHPSFQVAAVNPAGKGELSPLQDIGWCKNSTMEPAGGASNLSAGVIATIAVLLCAAVSSILVMALLVVIAIEYRNRKNAQVISNNKGVTTAQNPHDPAYTHQDQKQSKFGSCNSSDAKQKKTQSGPAPLVYAEVIAVKQNKVAEPTSFEPTKYSAVEHQHPNEVQDAGSMA